MQNKYPTRFTGGIFIYDFTPFLLYVTRFSVWQWKNAQAVCVFWFIPRLLGTGGGAKSRWRKRSVLFEKIAKIIFVFKTAGK